MRLGRAWGICIFTACIVDATAQSTGITMTTSTSSSQAIEYAPSCGPVGSIRTIVTDTLEEALGPACMLIGNRDNVPASASCPSTPVPTSLPSDATVGRYYFVPPGQININENQHTLAVLCVVPSAIPATSTTALLLLTGAVALSAWLLRPARS